MPDADNRPPDAPPADQPADSPEGHAWRMGTAPGKGEAPPASQPGQGEHAEPAPPTSPDGGDPAGREVVHGPVVETVRMATAVDRHRMTEADEAGDQGADVAGIETILPPTKPPAGGPPPP